MIPTGLTSISWCVIVAQVTGHFADVLRHLLGSCIQDSAVCGFFGGRGAGLRHDGDSTQNWFK